MRVIEVVHKGRDNLTILSLYANNLVIDHSIVTRVAVVMQNGITLDSQTAPQLFDLSLTDRIEMKLGLFPKIVKGVYEAKLIVYDAINVEGIAWGDMNLSIV